MNLIVSGNVFNIVKYSSSKKLNTKSNSTQISVKSNILTYEWLNLAQSVQTNFFPINTDKFKNRKTIAWALSRHSHKYEKNSQFSKRWEEEEKKKKKLVALQAKVPLLALKRLLRHFKRTWNINPTS